MNRNLKKITATHLTTGISIKELPRRSTFRMSSKVTSREMMGVMKDMFEAEGIDIKDVLSMSLVDQVTELIILLVIIILVIVVIVITAKVFSR